MHSIGVAGNARTLSDPPISRLDLDRFVKVLECECQGMIEAVVGLGQERSQMIMRQVAIITDGHMAMR